jgi:hypothetical protein
MDGWMYGWMVTMWALGRYLCMCAVHVCIVAMYPYVRVHLFRVLLCILTNGCVRMGVHTLVRAECMCVFFYVATMSGAYTVLRVTSARTCADLPFHFRRLQYSLEAGVNAGLVTRACISSPTHVRAILATGADALDVAMAQSTLGHEFIVLLLVYGSESGHLVTKAMAQPVKYYDTARNVIVDAVLAERALPSAKLSNWARERKPLEARRMCGAVETILCRRSSTNHMRIEFGEGVGCAHVVEVLIAICRPDYKPVCACRRTVAHRNKVRARGKRTDTSDSGLQVAQYLCTRNCAHVT